MDGFGPSTLFGLDVISQRCRAFLGDDSLELSTGPHAVHESAAVVGVGTDFAVNSAIAHL